MKKAALPSNEQERLETLKEYEILDTLPEREFDDLTALAATICGAPIALISLVDESRQWFKSKVGIDGAETPRDLAFCAHTILQDDVFIVKNALEDDRFSDNPFVLEEPNVRFYAGAPLIAPDGMKLGAICVVDSQPRELRADQIEALSRLARQVISQMELRMRVKQLEITKTELRASHDAVVKANRAKMQFLANMSHEIRTPMNGIIGLTEVLLANEMSETHHDKLRIINTCGKTLLHLINDVLDYSKLDSHKLELEVEPFDMKAVAEDVLGLFAEQAQKKGLRVDFQLDPDVPRWLLGDSSRLSQILTNLMSNAIKFTEKGSVEVRIDLSKKCARGESHSIRVSVKDTGIGISREVQSRLFESFVQADASTTRRFGGSGLGLAISKALCELMSGSMTLESTEGVGSTFAFTFVAAQTKPPLKIVNETEALASAQTLKVLLAEDNHVNQMVGVSMLRKLGYQPVVVENGAEVLEKLHTESFDIILMDRHMPVMDGVQATEEVIRMLAPEKRPIIIAVTASALKEDEETCRAAGMRDFITKPVTLSQLEQTLSKWSSVIRHASS